MPTCVDPASPTWAQSRVFSPTEEPWPTCTRLSTFTPSPMRVAPTLARRCTRWSAPRCGRPGSPVPDCGILCHAPGLVFSKAKSIRPNHRAILQHHIVAQLAVLADHRMSMREESMPDPDPRINHDVRQNHRRRRRSRRLRQSRHTRRSARWRRPSPLGESPLSGESPRARRAAGRKCPPPEQTPGKDSSAEMWPPALRENPA